MSTFFYFSTFRQFECTFVFEGIVRFLVKDNVSLIPLSNILSTGHILNNSIATQRDSPPVLQIVYVYDVLNILPFLKDVEASIVLFLQMIV